MKETIRLNHCWLNNCSSALLSHEHWSLLIPNKSSQQRWLTASLLHCVWTQLWNARHYFFGDRNSPWLLDMGTSWYFSWKLNYFGIPKWKQGLFNIPQSGHESVYLLEPSFHSRTPNNSTFMKNISWCPCLKVRVNFLPRRNYAAHFTVPRMPC